jgi:hypothetical protein
LRAVGIERLLDLRIVEPEVLAQVADELQLLLPAVARILAEQCAELAAELSQHVGIDLAHRCWCIGGHRRR